MPQYAFGDESPIKFDIPDRLATNYNAAVEEFFKAQRRFLQKFGRQWDPHKDPIQIKWSKAQTKAWNEFGKIFNAKIKNEGPFHANDIMEDFLVKTAANAPSKPSKFGTVLSIAATGGMLYALLRGLNKPS